MKVCKNCGSNQNIEIHHIIPRSQCAVLKNIKVNLIPLCATCHRSHIGVHRNKKLNLKFKLELQKKLFSMFTKDFYTVQEIKQILETTDTNADKIVKILQRYKEGYKKEDIVRRLMGGRLY